jgi:hypothetical protein
MANAAAGQSLVAWLCDSGGPASACTCGRFWARARAIEVSLGSTVRARSSAGSSPSTPPACSSVAVAADAGFGRGWQSSCAACSRDTPSTARAPLTCAPPQTQHAHMSAQLPPALQGLVWHVEGGARHGTRWAAAMSSPRRRRVAPPAHAATAPLPVPARAARDHEAAPGKGGGGGGGRLLLEAPYPPARACPPKTCRAGRNWHAQSPSRLWDRRCSTPRRGAASCAGYPGRVARRKLRRGAKPALRVVRRPWRRGWAECPRVTFDSA